jgi:hypothetical protein
MGTRFGPDVPVALGSAGGGGTDPSVATLTPCNAGTCQGFSGTDVVGNQEEPLSA